MSFISRFRHRHEEPMKIEGGVAYYPNRSAIRALKEVERAERGEIELEEYVPYTSKKTKRRPRTPSSATADAGLSYSDLGQTYK